jgi:hypothetical protein
MIRLDDGGGAARPTTASPVFTFVSASPSSDHTCTSVVPAAPFQRRGPWTTKAAGGQSYPEARCPPSTLLCRACRRRQRHAKRCRTDKVLPSAIDSCNSPLTESCFSALRPPPPFLFFLLRMLIPVALPLTTATAPPAQHPQVPSAQAAPLRDSV